MIPRFDVVSGETISQIVLGDVRRCMAEVRAAYLALHDGGAVNPNSYFLRFPDQPGRRIIALPAHLGGEDAVSGIKWIASYPENVASGLPRASAVVVLNRADNGYPFACLEGSIISAARTAASALVALEELRGREGRRLGTLGIVGTGLIARYVYRFLREARWELGRVLLHDREPRWSSRFVERVCDPAHAPRAADLEETIRGSDVVLFTTTAAAPYVTSPALLEHRPLVLHLSLRDLSPDVVLEAHNVVDSVEHVLSADTSLHLAQQRCGHHRFIDGTLAGLIRGDFAVTRSKPVIFSPFGLGVLDLAVARWVHGAAQAAGAAVTIDGFFHDLER